MLYKWDIVLACGCEWGKRDARKQDIPDLGNVFVCNQHGEQEVKKVRYRGQ